MAMAILRFFLTQTKIDIASLRNNFIYVNCEFAWMNYIYVESF